MSLPNSNEVSPKVDYNNPDGGGPVVDPLRKLRMQYLQNNLSGLGLSPDQASDFDLHNEGEDPYGFVDISRELLPLNKAISFESNLSSENIEYLKSLGVRVEGNKLIADHARFDVEAPSFLPSVESNAGTFVLTKPVAYISVQPWAIESVGANILISYEDKTQEKFSVKINIEDWGTSVPEKKEAHPEVDHSHAIEITDNLQLELSDKDLHNTNEIKKLLTNKVVGYQLSSDGSLVTFEIRVDKKRYQYEVDRNNSDNWTLYCENKAEGSVTPVLSSSHERAIDLDNQAINFSYEISLLLGRERNNFPNNIETLKNQINARSSELNIVNHFVTKNTVVLTIRSNDGQQYEYEVEKNNPVNGSLYKEVSVNEKMGNKLIHTVSEADNVYNPVDNTLHVNIPTPPLVDIPEGEPPQTYGYPDNYVYSEDGSFSYPGKWDPVPGSYVPEIEDLVPQSRNEILKMRHRLTDFLESFGKSNINQNDSVEDIILKLKSFDYISEGDPQPFKITKVEKNQNFVLFQAKDTNDNPYTVILQYSNRNNNFYPHRSLLGNISLSDFLDTEREKFVSESNNFSNDKQNAWRAADYIASLLDPDDPLTLESVKSVISTINDPNYEAEVLGTDFLGNQLAILLKKGGKSFYFDLYRTNSGVRVKDSDIKQAIDFYNRDNTGSTGEIVPRNNPILT